MLQTSRTSWKERVPKSFSTWCCDRSAFSIRRFIKLYSCCRSPSGKKHSLGSFFKDPTEELQPVLSLEQQIKAELHAYEAMPKLDPEGSILLVESAESQVSGLAQTCSLIYQFEQPALHLNVCSVLQATLLPRKTIIIIKSSYELDSMLCKSALE